MELPSELLKYVDLSSLAMASSAYAAMVVSLMAPMPSLLLAQTGVGHVVVVAALPYDHVNF